MEERKLDLKINFDKLEELSGKLKNYYDALSTMKTSVDSIQKKIEADNKGKSITALVECYEAVSNNISASKTEMKDVYKLIDGYKEDLKMYIKPLDSSKTMRVDRCDIYWNLQSLKGATDALNTSYTYHKTEFISGLTENSTEATNNYAKMEEIWNTLIPNFQEKIDVLKEDMDTIYKNKIVKFDEVDLEYQKKAANLFAKYSSIPEVVLDEVADDFEVQKDIFVGTAEAIGGFIKGVGTLAILPEIQFAEDVQKTINGINALTKGEYEEWAKGEEAKEKAKRDAVLDGIKEFLEDPGETIESGLEKKFQNLSDEADVEGISYVAGREGTKIAIDVGVAVATDGLLSGEGVAGKAVVSGEAAAAETAGIEIGVAAEETVGKTVASGLDDVVEGSSKTIIKTQKNIEIPVLPEGSRWERNVLNSFEGGKSNPVTYEGGQVLYRVGGKNGGFWSLDPPPTTEYQWRVDTAIKQEFSNDGSTLYKMTIPEGSTLSGLEGKVGSQGMGLYGGAHQVYIDYREIPSDWIEIAPTIWK